MLDEEQAKYAAGLFRPRDMPHEPGYVQSKQVVLVISRRLGRASSTAWKLLAEQQAELE